MGGEGIAKVCTRFIGGFPGGEAIINVRPKMKNESPLLSNSELSIVDEYADIGSFTESDTLNSSSKVKSEKKVFLLSADRVEISGMTSIEVFIVNGDYVPKKTRTGTWEDEEFDKMKTKYLEKHGDITFFPSGWTPEQADITNSKCVYIEDRSNKLTFLTCLASLYKGNRARVLVVPRRDETVIIGKNDVLTVGGL